MFGGHHLYTSYSVLHRYAKGKYLWQVYRALLYILKAGADINLHDYNGQTPFQMALRGSDCGPFNKKAARILIHAGVDVHTVDYMGRSCLAHANHNGEMAKLLISHDATVTADTMFAAIDTQSGVFYRLFFHRE